MSSNPQLLSEILVGPPDEADYDAIYAELVATPRGRWFLNEYAGRHRFADTHMLAGAIARLEAAVRGEGVPQVPAALAREIADLAVAIGRIEEEMAARLRLASEGFASAERIQDVAFALREREVDAELCDVLEGAIRELGEVFARGDAATERAQNALALLRELKGRVHALVADAIADTGVSLAGAKSGTIADDGFGEDIDVSDASLMERSAAEAQADEHFAAMIGALAASFPVPDEQGEPEPPGEPAASPAAEPEAGFEPAGGEPPAEIGPLAEDAGSVETQMSAEALVISAATEALEAHVAEPPLGNEPAEPEFEPAAIDSELAPPAGAPEPSSPEPAASEPPPLPEPRSPEPVAIEHSEPEQLTSEDRVAESLAAGPAVDGMAALDRPEDERAAENLAAEGFADDQAVAVDRNDAADDAAVAPTVSAATDDGGTPSEHEVQPTTANPAASLAEWPLVGASVEAPADGELHEGIVETSHEARSHGALSLEGGTATAGEGLPPLDQSAEPSAGRADAADLTVTDLPVTDLPVTDLPVTDLPVTDLKVVTELPATELPATADLPSVDLAQAVLAEATSRGGSEDIAGSEGSEAVAVSPPEGAEHAETSSAAYPLGTVIAPHDDSDERFDHTAEQSSFEPTEAPATTAGDAAAPLNEAETMPQWLPDSRAAGPEEDPGDLFEPLLMPLPVSQPAGVDVTHEGDADAVASVAAVQSDARARAPTAPAVPSMVPAEPAAASPAPPSPQMRLPLESPAPPQPRATASPTARSLPRPAPNDPLAALRALSEEELIALFS